MKTPTKSTSLTSPVASSILKPVNVGTDERRFEFEPDCIKLTRENLPTFEWLPMTCAYRLLAEGKDLPAWHPLLTGSKAAMHGERISVRHIAVKESEVIDWQDHILNKPDWAQ